MKRPNTVVSDSTVDQDGVVSAFDVVKSQEDFVTESAQILLSFSSKESKKADITSKSDKKRSRPFKKRRTEVEEDHQVKPENALSSATPGALVSDDEDDGDDVMPLASSLSSRRRRATAAATATVSSSSLTGAAIPLLPLSRPPPLVLGITKTNWREISRPLPPPPRLPRFATGVIFTSASKRR